MRGYRLYKNEKLRSLTAIDNLFATMRGKTAKQRQECSDTHNVRSVMAYPWRAVWRVNDYRANTGSERWQFLISVPKKRLHKAVERVAMRRRMREAYRLSRREMCENSAVDIAFIYVADKLTDFKLSTKSMSKIMDRIEHDLTVNETAAPEQSSNIMGEK